MLLTVGLIEWLELQCLQWRLSLGKTVLTKQKVFIEKLRDLNSSIGQIVVYYFINTARGCWLANLLQQIHKRNLFPDECYILPFIFHPLLCLFVSCPPPVLISGPFFLYRVKGVMMEALGPKAILAGRCSKSRVAVLVEQGHTHTDTEREKHTH